MRTDLDLELDLELEIPMAQVNADSEAVRLGLSTPLQERAGLGARARDRAPHQRTRPKDAT